MMGEVRLEGSPPSRRQFLLLAARPGWHLLWDSVARAHGDHGVLYAQPSPQSVPGSQLPLPLILTPPPCPCRGE